MKAVTVNGVNLTDEALSELRWLQQGVDNETDLAQGEPNIGLAGRLEMIDKVTRFLISLEIDENSSRVLSLLKELGYVRDGLNALRLPNGKDNSSN